MVERASIILLCIWSFWSVCCWLNGRRYRRQYLSWKKNEDSHRPKLSSLPSAVIWAPVKGCPDQLEAYLERTLNQDYPDYKVVFCFESVSDPGFRKIRQYLAADVRQSPGLDSIQMVVAGLSTDQGQKIHNLLAAYREDGGFGDVIAFVDADSVWEENTLRLLVEGLEKNNATLSTGYRWLIPSEQRFGAILASTINGSISTLLGPYWRNSAWAGAMAIRRQSFEEEDLANVLRGRVSDDIVISDHLIRAGHKIEFCPGVTPIGWVGYNLRDCIKFGRRQYGHFWVCRRAMWFYAYAATGGYLGGWVICILLIASGHPLAILPAAITYIADIALGFERRKIAQTLFPPEVTSKLRLVHVLDSFFTPLWMAVHYLVLLSTFGSRHVDWGGIRYRITRTTTAIISRADSTDPSVADSLH